MQFVGFLALAAGALFLWAAYWGVPLGALISSFVKGEKLPARRPVGQ